MPCAGWKLKPAALRIHSLTRLSKLAGGRRPARRLVQGATMITWGQCQPEGVLAAVLWTLELSALPPISSAHLPLYVNFLGTNTPQELAFFFSQYTQPDRITEIPVQRGEELRG